MVPTRRHVFPPLLVPMTCEVAQLPVLPHALVPSTHPCDGDIQVMDWASKPTGTPTARAGTVMAVDARAVEMAAPQITLRTIRLVSVIKAPILTVEPTWSAMSIKTP